MERIWEGFSLNIQLGSRVPLFLLLISLLSNGDVVGKVGLDPDVFGAF